MATGHDGYRDTRVWPGAKRDQERVESRPADAKPAAKGGATVPSPKTAPEWVPESDVRAEAGDAVRRGRRPARKRSGPARPASAPEREAAPASPASPPGDPAAELARAVGVRRAARSTQALNDATRAFRRERYREAAKLLRPLAELAPQVSSLRELYGLTLYRLGQWRNAVRELEAFATLTSSTEQHPVLADSYRALRRWAEVERLWEELRAASPSAALVAEGRIVMAGTLADRDRLAEAVALLDRARWQVKRPRDHHLATAYALADLLERSGDLARARETFRWVADADPDFADVRRRLGALR